MKVYVVHGYTYGEEYRVYAVFHSEDLAKAYKESVECASRATVDEMEVI